MAQISSFMLSRAIIIIILLTAVSTVVDSNNTTPVPADRSKISVWFKRHVKPYAARKGTLDAALVTAEAGARVIKVKKDGRGDFKTVTDAINSIPAKNTKRVVVWIGGGEYHEKIRIDRTKPFVTLYGSRQDMPRLSFAGTAAQYGTVYSATLAVESDYFTAANLVIINSAPRPDGRRKGAQAVAMRISGEKAAFYSCKIIGYQDTVCDDKGKHFFKDCFIQGTVDFIFGDGKSLYLNTELHILLDKGLRVITAQARESNTDNSGYSFVHCNITGRGNGGAYLGRAWKMRSRVVYAYTRMSTVVNSAGWSNNFRPQFEKTVFYREYMCFGPGSRNNRRVKYAKELTDAQAQPFLSLDDIEAFKWLLPPPKLHKNV